MYVEENGALTVEAVPDDAPIPQVQSIALDPAH
jgi:hypothetical protein